MSGMDNPPQAQDRTVGGAPDRCREHLIAARADAALISGVIGLATDLPDEAMRDDATQLVEAIEVALQALDRLGMGIDE